MVNVGGEGTVTNLSSALDCCYFSTEMLELWESSHILGILVWLITPGGKVYRLSFNFLGRR